MRWLDIILPEPGTHRNLDTALEQARSLAAGIPALQERDGLDGLHVTGCMAETGQLLFRAIADLDPGAFVPERDAAAETPELGDVRHDGTTGYHLVVPEAWRDLPWSWLHNGLDHLLVKHPICWSGHGAALPATADRPWMERQIRAGFVVGDGGHTGLRQTLAHLRDAGPERPSLLFVAGHSEETVRLLIEREATAIAAALAAAPYGEALAHFEVPDGTVTPTRLREQALAYQAIHYAGPTSRPAALADQADDRWLERLIQDAAATPDAEMDGALGLEEMPVGVDQVTALLDTVSARADRGRPADGAAHALPARGQWLLADGPVRPEGFGHGAGLPPLVFSNHHLALSELGARFTRAGASTVIGPLAPLYSRPARRFAGHVYEALGEGWCAGAAVWRAAGALREAVGANHPAWLSYGLQGYGTLALQYL
jgi:hypothetical protein